MSANEYKTYGVYKVRKMTSNKQVSYSIGLPPEIGSPLAGKKFRISISGTDIILTPHLAGEDSTQTVEPAPEAVALARQFDA
jgi:hypothetical protein